MDRGEPLPAGVTGSWVRDGVAVPYEPSAPLPSDARADPDAGVDCATADREPADTIGEVEVE